MKNRPHITTLLKLHRMGTPQCMKNQLAAFRISENLRHYLLTVNITIPDHSDVGLIHRGTNNIHRINLIYLQEFTALISESRQRKIFTRIKIQSLKNNTQTFHKMKTTQMPMTAVMMILNHMLKKIIIHTKEIEMNSINDHTVQSMTVKIQDQKRIHTTNLIQPNSKGITTML
jgi:hypothetical protein